MNQSITIRLIPARERHVFILNVICLSLFSSQASNNPLSITLKYSIRRKFDSNPGDGSLEKMAKQGINAVIVQVSQVCVHLFRQSAKS